jgi:hypothetical protein
LYGRAGNFVKAYSSPYSLGYSSRTTPI